MKYSVTMARNGSANAAGSAEKPIALCRASAMVDKSVWSSGDGHLTVGEAAANW